MKRYEVVPLAFRMGCGAIGAFMAKLVQLMQLYVGGGAMIHPERESKSLEFKSKVVNLSALIKTCVAFANGIGGEVIIGIEDRTRQVIGIDELTREQIYEKFPNALYDSTQPSLFPQIYEKKMGSQSILIIKIAPASKKPCFIKSSGIPDGVYCRVGAHTRKATSHHIDELMREGRQLYDSEPIDAQKEILDNALIKDFYSSSKVIAKRLLNDKILTQRVGNHEILVPTVSGVLLFSHEPHIYIPEAQIICTQFSGREGRDINQTEEIQGNLLEQAEISLQLITKWLQKEYVLSGAQLKTKTIVPEVALREAINNALLHRKYNIPGAVKIALYDDRLEIFSPGQFPGLVDINNLGDGTTFLRNPTLVRLARRLGLVEKLGSGIQLIFSSCAQSGLKRPVYSENGDFVKITFHFLPALSRESGQDELIMAQFKFSSELTIDGITKSLSISRNTATRYLNKLIEQGKIMRKGKGPAVRYVLQTEVKPD